MIKLKDLISESYLKEDDVVKNKKTGNVYMVKKMDPAKHDRPTPAEVDKAKQANGGQLPKGEQPSKPTQQPQQQKPQGQKLGGNDFKSSAEKGNNDDVDISNWSTDGRGKALYNGKPVADYVYSPDTDVFVTKTPNGREYFDTQEDMFKYLQKSKEEPKKSAFGPGGTAGSFGDTTKDDFYNAGETLRQMGWTPDDIAKRIGANLPDIDDEKDIPQIKDSDDKEDWINLYKKSIAMKKAGYSSSEIADKLRANL